MFHKMDLSSSSFRIGVAFLIATFLSYDGLRKKSLNVSGAAAAFLVGFISFAASFKFGIVLILFYYTGSKLTKFKQNLKAKLEEDYKIGGQRNAIQVLANSLLATVVVVCYVWYIGEDYGIISSDHASEDVIFLNVLSISKFNLNCYLTMMYLAHYSCATADTWASELGILSKDAPRLVTSFFRKTVPHGTNGGMSKLGTIASGAGGAFIGIMYSLMCIVAIWTVGGHVSMAFLVPTASITLSCTVFGLLGSLYDSLLGATLQATYYSKSRKCIVKEAPPVVDATRNSLKLKTDQEDAVVCVCGRDILSNEAVNFVSILMTMISAVLLTPIIMTLL